ncbi:MAG: valine--tRNA ligase [Rickettsiales bacterium]|jgi:valyl-tRNA synthetase|nr:valine--tRNA ligase [Rickettsiales bacterium]
MAYEKNNAYARRLYEKQEENRMFAADPSSERERFSIMMPPPNVTGDLHIGHAFTMTRQDISARYQRMLGRDVLWLPGTDHASIAVQLMVEKQLGAEGTSRRALGREGFLARAWEWKNTHAGKIQNQLRTLGCSCDWTREAFTMNPNFSRAVEHAFIAMHADGLIYRTESLVNWDPSMLTSVSDLEVISVEEQGTMYYIRYDVEGESDGIVIATVRPETKLGDGAIAVNPNDNRLARLVGKFAILPFAGRRLPIIADEHADPAKGSGAVKITPAHDFNDYEVGKRHGIKPINIFTPDAKIDISEIDNPNDFIRSLAGKDRFEAREIMVDKLREDGRLVKAEPCVHQVPHAERGGAVLEPRLTTQWYCDVKKLADAAVEKARSGELEFIPETWRNTWYSWLENVRPWCISRQLWWGHQIPAYYDDKGKLAYVGANPPAGLRRDEDVLDTWFSSGLWPMATLGWPDESALDFKAYFPNSILITGFDIIFFWVARMAMMSLYFTGKTPFRKVILHGLVVDEHGAKMSKTKGNGINPMDYIDEFGIDAVRFAICACANQNRTNPFGKKDAENARRFLTKLTNAAEFWKINGIADADKSKSEFIRPVSNWILNRVNKCVINAKKHLENYRYDEYAEDIYHLVWDDFCSTFIEAYKKDKNDDTLAAAHTALKSILKILQPAAPFISAELWEKFGFGTAVDFIKEPFPQIAAANIDKAEEFDLYQRARRTEENLRLREAETAELDRRIASLNAQLANQDFVKNAKPEVVEQRRESLRQAEERKRAISQQ